MEIFWKIENSGIGGFFKISITKIPSPDSFFFIVACFEAARYSRMIIETKEWLNFGISAIVIMTPDYYGETMRNKPILADMKAVQDQLVQCIAAGGRRVRWSIWKDLDVLRKGG